MTARESERQREEERESSTLESENENENDGQMLDPKDIYRYAQPRYAISMYTHTHSHSVLLSPPLSLALGVCAH